jgi:hypothetical protein
MKTTDAPQPLVMPPCGFTPGPGRLSRQLTPIERMIDAATGNNAPDRPREPTTEEKTAAANLARDVVSNLRWAYPDLLKNAPSTVPVHLRNTIAEMVARLLVNRS